MKADVVGRCRFWVWLFALSASARAASAEPEATRETSTAVSAGPVGVASETDPLEQAVALGLSAFAARDFASALVHFDQAIALATVPEQKGILTFNAAVCAFELGDFAAAERRFLLAAATGFSDADGARLHAGFAALRQGALARARTHADAALALDPKTQALRRDLLSEVEQAHRAQTRRRALQHVDAGYAALARDDPDGARQDFEAALRSSEGLQPDEIADVDYGLALVAHAQRQPSAALAYARRALERRPCGAELHRLRGIVYEGMGNVPLAIQSYREALRCGAPRDKARELEAAIDELHPLGPTGWFGLLQLGAGYDSNASQSGTAASRGVATPSGSLLLDATSEARVASPLVSADLQLGHHHWLAPDLTLSGAYTVSGLNLTRAEARTLSLWVQELSFGLNLAPTLRSRLSWNVGAAFLSSGLPPTTPFVFEGFTSVGGALKTAEHWTTSGEVRATKVSGLGDNAASSGARFELTLSERWAIPRVVVTALARITLNQVGTESIPVSAESFPICRNAADVPRFVCEGLSFGIPLSTFAPAVALRTKWSPWPPLELTFSPAVRRTLYLEPSGLFLQGADAPIDVTGKRRRDWSFDLPLDVRVRPVGTSGFFVFGRQSLRINRSNLDPDPTDPAHRFDYEDGNYVRHVSELGVGYGW